MKWYYQILDTDCLISCIYNILVNFHNLKCSYKDFLMKFPTKSLNLYELETFLNNIGIKISILSISSLMIQSLEIKEPLIILSKDLIYHARIYLSRKINIYRVFCPQLGFLQIKYHDMKLNPNQNIVIKVISFNQNIYTKNNLFLNTILKPPIKNIIWRNYLWRISLIWVFIISRYIFIHYLFNINWEIFLIWILTLIIFIINIIAKNYKKQIFNNIVNIIIYSILFITILLLNWRDIIWITLIFIVIIYNLFYTRRIMYIKQILLYIFTFMNILFLNNIANMLSNFVIIFLVIEIIAIIRSKFSSKRISILYFF